MKSESREILKIAVPSIITNITTPLLALMDVVIVGHMGAASYIAAIAVGGTMFNMLYWLFSFLRMGTGGLSAQAHGAGDGRESSLVLLRGVFTALLGAATLIALQSPLAALSFRLMDVAGVERELAGLYFSILIWGAPAVLLTSTMSGWLIGRKDARSPMWVAIAVNVTNIAFSLALVLGLGWKIEGVAYGTLAAQWTGAVAIAVCTLRHRPQWMPLAQILRLEPLRRFAKINSDIFLRTLCIIAVTVWFTRVGSAQGTVMLAVNTLLMQFFVFFSYFMDGFAYAGEALCGNLLGARDEAPLRSMVSALTRWGVACALFFTLLYGVGGEALLSLMSSDGEVVGRAVEFRAWMLVIPFAGFGAFMWDGLSIGATATRAMLISMLAGAAVYFAVYFTLFPSMGNHALWLAFTLYLATRSGMLYAMRRQILRPRE